MLHNPEQLGLIDISKNLAIVQCATTIRIISHDFRREGTAITILNFSNGWGGEGASIKILGFVLLLNSPVDRVLLDQR